jgi:hypothetical protein
MATRFVTVGRTENVGRGVDAAAAGATRRRRSSGRLTAIQGCVQQDIAPRREAHFDLQVIQTYAPDTASRYDRRRHIRNVSLARTRP